MGVSYFLIIAASAYLLGSLSFAIIICRLTLGKDIRAYGSGNAGLTNAYRTMGAGRTLLVLCGDIGKAAAALAIGGLLAGTMGKLVAGMFVILGHVFPVYFGFRGGKGVLAGATMLAFLDWRIFVTAVGLFLLAVLLQIVYGDARLTALAALMAAAVVFMHRSNIKRILSGTENRFSFHSKPQITKEKK